jgi:23S rRNA pseudouridine1911/1915/1917 synthase
MVRNHEFEIVSAEEGVRLDRTVLAHVPRSTRALVLDAIAAGRVLLDGRPAAKGRIVRAGGRVTVLELAEAADLAVQPQPELPLAILYQDDDLLAVDKPAGQPVQPLDYRERGTLLNALVGRFPDLQTVGGEPLMPAVLHRLDTETSGLVLVARRAPAYADLRRQFAAHVVRKTYLAVVAGPLAAGGRLDWPLAHCPGQRGRMLALDPGQPPPRGERPMRAVTDFAPLASAGGLTLLRVIIHTGVTHQIRCHLARAGHPVVGDRLYGGPPATASSAAGSRHLLHAAEIAFDHPTRREAVVLAAPAPADFPPALLGWLAGTTET